MSADATPPDTRTPIPAAENGRMAAAGGHESSVDIVAVPTPVTPVFVPVAAAEDAADTARTTAASAPSGTPAGIPTEGGQPTSLWRNGDFVRLWLGQVVSTMGTGMSRLALPLLVLALTQSPAQAGLIGAAQTVPFIILGLPAGALLDRWNRKTTMIVCDMLRFLAFGSVPVAWWLGALTPPHLYAVAFIHGSALVFFDIAQLAALPRVVPKGQLAEAHSLNTATNGIGTLISPGVAGAVISAASSVPAGAALAYLADSVSYAVSFASLATIRAPFQTPRNAPPLRQIHRQILEGLAFIWHRLDLRLLNTLNTLHRTCFAPVQLVMVIMAQQAFGADAKTIGLLFSAAGAGGLAAAAFTPRLRKRVQVGHSMVGLTIVHALALGCVALAPNAFVAAAGLFVAGAMENMTGIVQVSYRLVTIPDAMQGRVNSSYRLFSFTGISVGQAIAGLLLAIYPGRVVLGIISAAIGVIALGAFISPLRRLKG